MKHEAMMQENAWQKREVEQLVEANEKLSETLEQERHERAQQQRRLDDARGEASQLKANIRTLTSQWKRDRERLQNDADALDGRLKEVTRKLRAANEATEDWQAASADREWKLQATVETLQDKLKAAEKISVKCTVKEEQMAEQGRVHDEKLRDKQRQIEELQQSQRNLMQELLQLAQSHDEIRGDYEKAIKFVHDLQKRERGHSLATNDPGPSTSTPLATPQLRSRPLVNSTETPIMSAQGEQRQRPHAETSSDVILDSQSPSLQDTLPLQTSSAGSSLYYDDVTPAASIKFRSVSDVVAYLHDDEVQENINELLKQITNDETLADINDIITQS